MSNFMRKDTLSELNNILFQLNMISYELRKEELVCSSELEDAQRLGLTGEDRIRHYNDWMRKYDLEYLCI